MSRAAVWTSNFTRSAAVCTTALAGCFGTVGGGGGGPSDTSATSTGSEASTDGPATAGNDAAGLTGDQGEVDVDSGYDGGPETSSSSSSAGSTDTGSSSSASSGSGSDTTSGGVCTPHARRCTDAAVERCSPGGDAWEVEESCSGTCEDDPPRCAATVCAAGQRACDGTTATRCNATGSGYEPGGIDCNTFGQLCRVGRCWTSNTVNVGTGGLDFVAGSTRVIGTFYRVDEDVILRVVSSYLELTGTRDAAWVVYEADTSAGPYEFIFSRSDTLSAGFGFIDSPALGIQLDGGKSYIVGVAIDGPVDAYYSAAGGTAAPSWGAAEAWVGGPVAFADYADDIPGDATYRDTNWVAVQRLETLAQ